MGILNQAVVNDVANFVIRQATTSIASTSVPSPSPIPNTSTTNTGATTMTNTMPTSSTMPSPTGDSDGSGNGNGGSSGSSSLLFFVALGFGVVFTNLWIIVGVKYCFRYNARNRALARLDENGEPIDLQNMPARPHRRRREKKLMTMDEVNEKFPMVKYKTWVLDRQKEGLPTAGGISPSRANSVRSVQGIVPAVEPEQPLANRQSSEEHVGDVAAAAAKTTDADRKDLNNETATAKTTGAANDNRESVDDTRSTRAPSAETSTSEIQPAKARTSEDEDEDEDDHIDAALPPELLNSSGDTCAICIDTLEDDDDVRGLTCGHAFHAVCLDPWLTNRRACCPLCKADYYVPKARPQPAEGEAQDPTSPVDSRNNGRINMPRAPMRSFAWSHFRDAPRQIFPTRLSGTGMSTDPALRDRQRQRRAPVRPSRTNNGDPARVEGGNAVTRFRNRVPPFRLEALRRNRGQPNEASQSAANDGTAPANTTPSHLEAGVRPSTAPNN
ncbi:hypothetical protein F5Y18DRAFT_424824 [Xylariaceae sp. FL1019]|nr:hypothetical protein F5Y18DRAFT_424824 [Xylariaceae sp. FL1019]